MVSENIKINGFEVCCHSINTLVIGSGAAALNAAASLVSFGQEDIAIVTEKWGGGTSNNAGSDKQTYYKLSLSGDSPDSALLMAGDLFGGRCMHGDIALCEAQGSVQAFMNLIRLGVPFPANRYGAWVGYRTDNDPMARATSAGPHTSGRMFEVLATEVKSKKIKVFDRYQVIALLHKDERAGRKITGAIALDLNAIDIRSAFTVFNAVNTVLGTGGPAGIYETSAYPPSQAGSTGIAFEAGATGQNLTETQFGIASIKHRWNLSGSYQQVIPRYISTTPGGNDEKEFLNDFFPNLKTLARAIFLKGYQWPFDAGKIQKYGSSLIDLLVHREIVFRNRRVFLDYSRNPSGRKNERFETAKLDPEVRHYLGKSGVKGKTPYTRLVSLNRPAIDVYRDKHIDLKNDYLEIAVCAQHNNGGLKGNIWWESDIKHLFPVGEVNGSHGVSRPGGAALNSGQVGSYRAAFFIREKYNGNPLPLKIFMRDSLRQIEERIETALSWHSRKVKFNHSGLLGVIRKRMSDNGGIVRSLRNIEEASNSAAEMMKNLKERISAGNVRETALGFRLLDHCLTHFIYLEAIKKYLADGGRSRGSFIVTDNDGIIPVKGLGEEWKYSVCSYDRRIENNILEVGFKGGKPVKKLREVREIPQQELWFEKVWKKNLEDNATGC